VKTFLKVRLSVLSPLTSTLRSINRNRGTSGAKTRPVVSLSSVLSSGKIPELQSSLSIGTQTLSTATLPHSRADDARSIGFYYCYSSSIEPEFPPDLLNINSFSK